jgi:hypothetical protein
VAFSVVAAPLDGQIKKPFGIDARQSLGAKT